MPRRKISEKVLTKILIDCRRRCCLCFGLNRDTQIKSGQIAHIDRDSSNNGAENLTFLCLEHHDDYDSKTSQRKGLTIDEVKSFRDDLTNQIRVAFSQQVHFGSITTPKNDPFAGVYIRVGESSETSELTLSPVPDDPEGNAQYCVTGIALHGEDRPTGPNIGVLNSLGSLDEGTIILSESFTDIAMRVILRFIGTNQLEVEDTSSIGWHGFGVNFSGVYERS
jgi:hypothetical protein